MRVFLTSLAAMMNQLTRWQPQRVSHELAPRLFPLPRIRAHETNAHEHHPGRHHERFKVSRQRVFARPPRGALRRRRDPPRPSTRAADAISQQQIPRAHHRSKPRSARRTVPREIRVRLHRARARRFSDFPRSRPRPSPPLESEHAHRLLSRRRQRRARVVVVVIIRVAALRRRHSASTARASASTLARAVLTAGLRRGGGRHIPTATRTTRVSRASARARTKRRDARACREVERESARAVEASERRQSSCRARFGTR